MNQFEFFKTNGYVVLKQAIEHELLDKYLDAWDEDNSSNFDEYGNNFGWQKEFEYLNHPEIMDVMCHHSIYNFFDEIQLAVALHRVDTWGTSSQKPWHQDSVFSNPTAYNNYIGAWVASEKIHPEAGPFQLIPTSHNWKLDKYSAYFGENSGEIIDGRWVNKYIKQAIQDHSDIEPFTFLGEKGDILIWHGNLLHRALIPTDTSILRRAIIGHYTNTLHNEQAKDETYFNTMVELAANPKIKQWNGKYYFDFR